MTGSAKPSETVLVTGGCGFIGSHFCEALLAEGHHVIAIDDLSTGRLENVEDLRSNPNFAFHIDTIINPPLLDRLVGESDVIFHLAAAVGVELIIRDPIHVIETNILGTITVLKAAARHRCRTFLASTSEIYGKSEETPFDEEGDRLLGPTTRWRWSYSTSKAVDEYLGLAYHRQAGLPVTIFRPFNTVGPRQTGHYGMVIPRFVEQALAGEKLTVYGDGTQSRSFCDVRDTIRALKGLMSEPTTPGKVFNIGSPNEISILELARKVLCLTGGERSSSADDRIEFVPYDEAYEAGFEDMHTRTPDLTRIHGTIGWTPQIPFEATLEEIIAHHRLRRGD